MPIEINGVFWTFQELAKECGLSYSYMSLKYQNTQGILRIGRAILVPDKLAQLILEDEKISRDEKDFSIGECSVQLGVAYRLVAAILKDGFPYIAKGKNKKISYEHFVYLKKAVDVERSGYNCIEKDRAHDICQRALDYMRDDGIKI